MIPVQDIHRFDFKSVPIDAFWNVGDEKELSVHRIHGYPAKFPAFITTKALKFAEQQERKVRSIADVFCGCGTTAFEAKRNNIDYWGCDINPVATLIAKTKSRKYQKKRLDSYLLEIRKLFETFEITNEYADANERLKYWYKRRQYNQLFHLQWSIFEATPNTGDYRRFFLCAFSNILKATSVWLTKSIKPQVDPDKKPSDVMSAFLAQCEFSIAANEEVGDLGDAGSKIVTDSFLAVDNLPRRIDLIITSPPYVTSYEYADLHQLSSLWLGMVEDYRQLREGAIGSLHHEYNFSREWKRLNRTGNHIVSSLLDQHKSKARSVAKYFLDMQKVAAKAYQMLSKNGLALFVIGNTEYKSVRIDNAKHLAESLFDAGFNQILASKRTITKKILTPYRDSRGKFSSDARGRKVYSEEFILVGMK